MPLTAVVGVHETGGGSAVLADRHRRGGDQHAVTVADLVGLPGAQPGAQQAVVGQQGRPPSASRQACARARSSVRSGWSWLTDQPSREQARAATPFRAQ